MDLEKLELDKKNNIPQIEIAHLRKSFGKNQVLKDINLVVNKRDNVVILGKSGVGKSVLIKCIVGLISFEAEKLIVLGKEISNLSLKALNEVRKKVGFLFQGSALYDSMTVRENLEFPLRGNSNYSEKASINEAVVNVLKNVGLLDAIDKMPGELSGGMRKRIGLARTLISRPEIMLYDEPTTGLDPITAKEISYLIMEMREKYNTTSIIITHDVSCAKITANRILLLQDGLFIAEGTFEELRKSSCRDVKLFFE